MKIAGSWRSFSLVVMSKYGSDAIYPDFHRGNPGPILIPCGKPIMNTVLPGSTGILSEAVRFAALCMNSGQLAGRVNGKAMMSQNEASSGCSSHSGSHPWYISTRCVFDAGNQRVMDEPWSQEANSTSICVGVRKSLSIHFFVSGCLPLMLCQLVIRNESPS